MEMTSHHMMQIAGTIRKKPNSKVALEYLSNIRFLSDSMVLVCTKIQIRTIVLEYKMRAHIISPREGSNLFNVVILLAFKALMLDFLDL